MFFSAQYKQCEITLWNFYFFQESFPFSPALYSFLGKITCEKKKEVDAFLV